MRASLEASARADASRLEKLKPILQRRLIWRDVLEQAKQTRLAEIAALSGVSDEMETRTAKGHRAERLLTLQDEIRVLDHGGNRWDRHLLLTIAVAAGMQPPAGSRNPIEGLFGHAHTCQQIDEVETAIAKIEARQEALAPA